MVGATAKVWVVIVIAIIVGVLLLARTGQNNIGGEVVVGAILPLSGAFTVYGDDEKKAFDIAAEEVKGTLRVVYEDSGGDNAKALAAYQKLTSIDGARMVVTSTSWVSNAIYPQAADTKVVQLIIASAAFRRTRDDAAIRFTVDVSDEAAFLAEYLRRYNRIALLSLNNDYGKGWAEQLKRELRENVVASESYLPTESDASAQLAKIKAANPDALVLISTAKEGGLFARKARELGINAAFVGTRPIQQQQLLEGKDAVEGLVYSYPDYNLNHPFVARYRERYGAEPSVFSAEAYDVLVTLAQAVKECGQDNACIARWYHSRVVEGALGKITFDEKGDAHYAFALKQVKQGQFVRYTS